MSLTRVRSHNVVVSVRQWRCAASLLLVILLLAACAGPGAQGTPTAPATAIETPAWETGKTITPSPHHPLGAKGVGESATVGAPPAIANAVVDALSHLGVDHIDIPITPQKVWAILHEKGVS